MSSNKELDLSQSESWRPEDWQTYADQVNDSVRDSLRKEDPYEGLTAETKDKRRKEELRQKLSKVFLGTVAGGCAIWITYEDFGYVIPVIGLVSSLGFIENIKQKQRRWRVENKLRVMLPNLVEDRGILIHKIAEEVCDNETYRE